MVYVSRTRSYGCISQRPDDNAELKRNPTMTTMAPPLTRPKLYMLLQ